MIFLFAVTSACLIGCDKETEEGGPGATPNGESGNSVNEDNTFTVDVPSSLSLTQGETDSFAIELNRGGEFTQSVNVEFMAPTGVTINPASGKIASGESEFTVQIAIDESAVPGEFKIGITATPETGKPVNSNLPLTIEKKEN
jgi:uncharacterized membrane protein